MEIENKDTSETPYISIKDRWHIVRLKGQGESGREAKIAPASKSAINGLHNKFLQTGDVVDLPHPGRQTKVIYREKEMVTETIDAQPDLSLGQLIEDIKWISPKQNAGRP